MALPALTEFLADRALLAIKISSNGRAGLFSKPLRIPPDTVGLALFPDGGSRRIPEGGDVSGNFELTLAKRGDVALRFPVGDLRSADGFPVQSSVTLGLSLETHRGDLLRDFVRSFFTFPGLYTTHDLKTALGPDLRTFVSGFAAARNASELHGRPLAGELETVLRPGLERSLFGTGVCLGKILEVHFTADEFARRSAAEAETRDEVKREVDRSHRKEERLRRLAAFLSDAHVQDILAQLPDSRMKGVFYAKLMEDDGALTPQELAAKVGECGEDLAELIYKAMDGILGGPGIDPSSVRPEKAAALFVASGTRILMFDPARMDAPPREFQFRDPVRSVRSAGSPQGPCLLVGARRSVHAVHLDGGDVLEFPLPDDRRPKGGVNAVAASGDRLFATHSEYGLARWDRRNPGHPGSLIWPELTHPHRTTRAVQVSGDRLLFATGSTVYATPVDDDGTAPIAYAAGLDSPITSLTSGAGAVFAGTESGAIVTWMLGEPARPAIVVRRKEPVVHLRIARIRSLPHLLYSTRDVSIRARVIGQNLETSYESGGVSVGALDAASDLLCASDTAGRHVLLWKIGAPARPDVMMDMAKYSEKPVLDVWMAKMHAQAG